MIGRGSAAPAGGRALTQALAGARRRVEPTNQRIKPQQRPLRRRRRRRRRRLLHLRVRARACGTCSTCGLLQVRACVRSRACSTCGTLRGWPPASASVRACRAVHALASASACVRGGRWCGGRRAEQRVGSARARTHTQVAQCWCTRRQGAAGERGRPRPVTRAAV
eukprot:scaffold4491_cov180-Prasinococcus_capsulatus_cf.AAC.1